jgi:hypothetical protein
MVKKEYKARAGAPFSNKDAPIIGKTLEGIFGKFGQVTPELIVDEARPEKSPLHKHFEWNDKTASEAYRRHQARQITNHLVEVVYTGPKKTKPVEIKAYESIYDQDTQQKSYKPIQVILETPSDRKQLLDRIIATIDYFTKLMKLLRAYEDKKRK